MMLVRVLASVGLGYKAQSLDCVRKSAFVAREDTNRCDDKFGLRVCVPVSKQLRTDGRTRTQRRDGRASRRPHLDRC